MGSNLRDSNIELRIAEELLLRALNKIHSLSK